MVAGAEPKSILFCREKHPERELWEGFRHGPEARAQDVRLRRRAAVRRARRGVAQADGESARAVLRPRARPGVGRAHPALAERGARARAHRGDRAGRDPRPARGAGRDAPGQGRARNRDHAARRRDFGRRARARDARDAARRDGVRGRGRAALRVPPPWRPVPGVLADRRRRRECLRAALSRQFAAARRRRPAADRRRLRARRLCLRHHAHVPGQRQVQRSAAGDLRSGARVAGRGDRGSQAGQRLERPARRGRESARARVHRPRALQRHARRGAREGTLQAVLHAPHRPLARAGRARRRRLQGARRVEANSCRA